MDKARTLRFFNLNLDRLEKMSHFEMNEVNYKRFLLIRNSLYLRFCRIINILKNTDRDIINKLNNLVLEFFKFTNEFSPDINKDRSIVLIKDKQSTLINKLIYFNDTLSHVYEKGGN